MTSQPLCLVYYCSGHGYGHATRVSAFARYLLSVQEKNTTAPVVYIVSSAPQHVFADSITYGARYRYAEIDPVIVQPLAYRVDRRKSVEVLQKFLSKKDDLLQRESQWLLQVNATCVLSDAAFLGCLAAKAVGIPSILITNFSFDSVYSYLSTSLLDATVMPQHQNERLDVAPSLLDMIPDDPIPHAELSPLVEQIYTGYRCADLLVRLPGYIPMPSFFVNPSLPSFDWVDVETRRMKTEIEAGLALRYDKQPLLPSIPFPKPYSSRRTRERRVIQAPLIVRPPNSALSPYTPEGRSHLLSSIGVPTHLHDPTKTKILIVSFGGQIFRRPQTPSKSHSRRPSRENVTSLNDTPTRDPALKIKDVNGIRLDINLGLKSFQDGIRPPPPAHFELHIPSSKAGTPDENCDPLVSPRLATPNHLWIPGAPPASKPPLSPTIPTSPSIPIFNTIPPTPYPQDNFFAEGLGGDEVPRLLPDASWIAIVCGVSKEQWAQNQDIDSELPEQFYVAPRDVYMPDLTAAGDVLLGKLGYGTVSECVDACTPFVYVSRPLFIEEHGLRLLLDQEGVGVELSRSSYEAGDWGSAVAEAVSRGANLKEKKRRAMSSGRGIGKREEEGKKLAGEVIDWVRAWWCDSDAIGEHA